MGNILLLRLCSSGLCLSCSLSVSRTSSFVVCNSLVKIEFFVLMRLDACHVTLLECFLCLASFFLQVTMLMPAYSAAFDDWLCTSMGAVDAGN